MSQTLMQKLSMNPELAMFKADAARADIFPGLRANFANPAVFSETYYCHSFYRERQTLELSADRFDAKAPFTFRDGRQYRVEEIFVEKINCDGVVKRCCVDIYHWNATPMQYLYFEAWFFKSAFRSGAIRYEDDRLMIEITRSRIKGFLQVNRHPVPRSRYGHPYIIYCR